MESLFDILYDILFQPQVGMKSIAKQKNVGWAFIVFLVSILLPMWALYFGIEATDMSAMIPIMIGFKIVGSLFMWIMGAALWQLMAEFFGGRGTALGLFAALGFAHIPYIFIVPLWALILAMPDSSQKGLMAIAVLVVMFWSFYLDIVAIKEVHQLTAAKAVLVMVMPLLIVGMVCVIGVIFIGSSLMHTPMCL